MNEFFFFLLVLKQQQFIVTKMYRQSLQNLVLFKHPISPLPLDLPSPFFHQNFFNLYVDNFVISILKTYVHQDLMVMMM